MFHYFCLYMFNVCRKILFRFFSFRTNMYKNVKCRKCRQVLFGKDECSKISNAHNWNVEDSTPCASITEEKLVFLNEDHLPEWVKSVIEAEQWSKGKLNCFHCNYRIGSFDFVSGMKCDCASFILPSVHLIKSKIDIIKAYNSCCFIDSPPL